MLKFILLLHFVLLPIISLAEEQHSEGRFDLDSIPGLDGKFLGAVTGGLNLGGVTGGGLIGGLVNSLDNSLDNILNNLGINVNGVSNGLLQQLLNFVKSLALCQVEYKPNVVTSYEGTITFNKNGRNYFCGAFFIKTSNLNLECAIDDQHTYTVLTAGSCAFGTTTIQVNAGTSENARVPKCSVVIPADSYKVHPRYDSSGKKNDITVIHISELFTDFHECAERVVVPIQIAREESELANPNDNTIAPAVQCGHGSNGLLDDTLVEQSQCSYFPKINNPLCNVLNLNLLNAADFKSKYCAGCLLNSACAGDSGSALIQVAPNNNYLAYGITSRGITPLGLTLCNVLPATFTSIPYFIDFIEDTICKLAE